MEVAGHLHQRGGIAVVVVHGEHTGRNFAPVPRRVQSAAADGESAYFHGRVDQQKGAVIRARAHRLPDGERAAGQGQRIGVDALGLHGTAGNIDLRRAFQPASIHNGAAGDGEQAVGIRGTVVCHVNLAILRFQRAAVDGDVGGVFGVNAADAALPIHVDGVSGVSVDIGRLGADSGELAVVEPDAAAGNIHAISAGDRDLTGTGNKQVAHGNVKAIGEEPRVSHLWNAPGHQPAITGDGDIASVQIHATGELRTISYAILHGIGLPGDRCQGAAGDQQGLILYTVIHVDANGHAETVCLGQTTRGRDMAALDREITIHGDARSVGPAIPGILVAARSYGQGARSLRAALNGEVSQGIQCGNENRISVLSIDTRRGVAAPDGVGAAIRQHDGAPTGQLHGGGSRGGEVDAAQGQGLRAAVPGGIRGSVRFMLIEQRNGRRAIVSGGKVRCFIGSFCRSRRSRQQGQAQAEGQQETCYSFLHEISSLSGDHILCFWGPCLHLRL